VDRGAVDDRLRRLRAVQRGAVDDPVADLVVDAPAADVVDDAGDRLGDFLCGLRPPARGGRR